MNGTDDIRALVLETLERIKQRIDENITSTGTRASGKTQESLQVIPGTLGGRLIGRSPFGTLETGRKPGKVPGNFRDIIRQWILDKGLAVVPIAYKRKQTSSWQPKYSPYERGLQQMAGAIAYTIRNKGTRLYRDGGRRDIYTNVIDEELDRLRNLLNEKLGQLVVERIPPTNLEIKQEL